VINFILFQSPPSLTKLSLKANDLKVISDGDVPFGRSLMELHLGSNRLSEVPKFIAQCSSLVSLNLSHNKIRFGNPKLPEIN